ncbi:MAG: hypothetical protein JW909_07055 [Planctomycetes bacterium]|nr:hypothetical protein [Planctomycetota bacterium]
MRILVTAALLCALCTVAGGEEVPGGPGEGAASGGVELRIEPSRFRHEPGETVRFDLYFRNLSGDKIRLAVEPRTPVTFEVLDSEGRPADMIRGGYRVMGKRVFRPGQDSVGIEPGARLLVPGIVLSYRTERGSGTLAFKKPGLYSVRAEYVPEREGEYLGVAVWSGKAVSNTVKLEAVDWGMPPDAAGGAAGLRCDLHMDRAAVPQGKPVWAAVVLTNCGEQALEVWNHAYSWGYFLDSLRVSAGEYTGVWRMPPRGWGKNYPGTLRIEPGGHRTRWVDAASLDRAPGAGVPFRGIMKPAAYSVEAIYECTDGEAYNVRGVWTGRAESGPSEAAVTKVDVLEKVNGMLGGLRLERPLADRDVLRLLSRHEAWSTVHPADPKAATAEPVAPRYNAVFSVYGDSARLITVPEDWYAALKEDGVNLTDEDTVGAAFIAAARLCPDARASYILEQQHSIDWLLARGDYGEAKPRPPSVTRKDLLYTAELWQAGRTGELIRVLATIGPGWCAETAVTVYEKREKAPAEAPGDAAGAEYAF